MTAPKPLSDEELDLLAKVEPYGEYPDSGLVDLEEYAQLIAQSREANRLHEQFAADLKSFAEMLLDDSGVDVETVRHALLQQARQLRDCCGDCDPAARAKRELGEWLASAPRRYFSEFAPEVMAPIGAPRRYNWTIKLTEHGTDMGIGNDPDRTKALLSALRAAKESGR